MKHSVDGLKNAISAMSKDLDDLSAGHLKVYKISVDNKPELHEILSTTESSQLLQGVEILEVIFSNVPFSRIPHIVVELPNKSKPSLHGIDLYSSSLTGISKPPPSAHRPITNANPITTACAVFLNSATKDKPSSTGAPSSFQK